MLNRTNVLIVMVAIAGAAFGLALGTFFGNSEPPAPPGVNVLKTGDKRLDLALTDPDGKPRRLSEWDGKRVLVNFWATWCGPCRDEMPLLDHARSQYPGLEVVGVAVDDAGAVRQYLKESPVRYPILLADEAPPSPALLYGDTRDVLPYSVLIGPDGTLLAQRAGSFTAESLGAWLKTAQ